MTPEQKQLFDRLTQLQQRVAINVLGGMSQRQAYYAAEGTASSDTSADATVCVMLRDARVKAFMDAMKLQAVSEAIMSREEMAKKLSLLSRTNLNDIVRFETKEIGRDPITGDVLKQTGWFIPDNILENPDKLAVISELEVGKFGPKIKTHSQLQAMAQLSKMMGYDAAQKIDATVTHRPAQELTDDELAALAASGDEQADYEG